MMAESDREVLGKRLRDTREYLGLTQEFVAKQTNIGRAAIIDIEAGKRRVDSLELKKLADLYRYPVTYFLDEDPQEDPPASSISALARTAKGLSEEDREEVLRYAEFLRAYKKTGERKK